MRDLREVDLNLLLLLQTLQRTRSVSAAARELGLSQPAASSGLKRLRAALGDALFVPTGRGMAPTAYMQTLAAPLASALATLSEALAPVQGFAPATAQRMFTLAMSELGEMFFLPRLLGRVAATAPGVTLATVRLGKPSMADDLMAGRADLAVGALVDLGPNVFRRKLFLQRSVCLVRPGHPLVGKPLTARRYADAQHAVIVSEGSGHERLNQQLERMGVRRHVALRLPYFAAAPYIARSTDLVITAPETLAEQTAGPLGLAVLRLPFRFPPYEISMAWRSGVHRDPGNRWLRSLLVELFAT